MLQLPYDGRQVAAGGMRIRLTTWLPALALLAGCSSDDETSGPRLPPADSDACPSAETPEACEVARLIDEERAARDLPVYGYDSALAAAAAAHTIDMTQNDYFSHDSLDGRTFGDRAVEAGYTGDPFGENIGLGQATAADIVQSWMGSDGHRDNILSTTADEIGAGFSAEHWVVVFGRK